jgi:hypothetical protein
MSLYAARQDDGLSGGDFKPDLSPREEFRSKRTKTMKHLLIASVALFGLAGAAFAQNAMPTSKHLDRTVTSSTTSSFCSASSDFSDNCTGEPAQASARMHSRPSVNLQAPATTETPSNGCAATGDFSDNC